MHLPHPQVERQTRSLPPVNLGCLIKACLSLWWLPESCITTSSYSFVLKCRGYGCLIMLQTQHAPDAPHESKPVRLSETSAPGSQRLLSCGMKDLLHIHFGVTALRWAVRSRLLCSHWKMHKHERIQAEAEKGIDPGDSTSSFLRPPSAPLLRFIILAIVWFIAVV